MALPVRVFRRLEWAVPEAIRQSAELTRRPDRYLAATGWLRSRQEGMPVDRHGDPLPWYTYPAISFLQPRIPPQAHVFEFGMGNSTLWWSRQAARVTACETDRIWFERIGSAMPGNVEALLHAVDSDAYPEAAVEHGARYSILVIDGRRRVACCRRSLDALAPDGVVIWDNSERDRYAEGYDFLASHGFRRLDFWGLGPLNVRGWCTSIFYRPENCLGV